MDLRDLAESEETRERASDTEGREVLACARRGAVRTAGEPGTEINLGRGAERMRESRRMTDGGTARGRGMDQSQSIC